MATRALNRVVQHLRHSMLQQASTRLRDGELLEGYISRRDEAAFQALVRRHGPMVLGVCKRILGNHADAEDAFQATFLVLVRKAGSIRQKNTVASWLYGVARHTALKARALNRKRRSKELLAGSIPKPHVAEQVFHQVQELVDQELSLLPEKYRSPIVLCHLEGKTIKQAADHLCWPPGTVATRLRRGRELLAGRLARHGLALSAAVVGSTLASSAAPAAVLAPLLVATLRAAHMLAAGQVLLSGVSADVAALTKGVLKAMLWSKLKNLTFMAFALVLLGLGVGGVSHSADPADPNDKNAQPAPVAPPAQAGKSQRPTAATSKHLLISTEVSGIIVEAIKPGAKVRPGTVVIRLDDRVARVDVDLAQANLEAAKAEQASASARLAYATRQAERMSNLLRAKAVEQAIYDEAVSRRDAAHAAADAKKASVKIAASDLEKARLLLAKFTLRSPVTGSVRAVFHQPGEFVKAGDRLVEIRSVPSGEGKKEPRDNLEAELEQLRERVTWSERMAKLGFLSETQVQAARNQLRDAVKALGEERQQPGSKVGRTDRPFYSMQALGERFRYRIPVEIGFTEFSHGGKLEILEVWGTRPRIEVGGQYLVRGKYAMPLHEGGTLYFYLTSHGKRINPDLAALGALGFGVPELDLQRVTLKKRQGEFTLLHGMFEPGSFHLDLQAKSGDRDVRVANVYFGTGDNVQRNRP